MWAVRALIFSLLLAPVLSGCMTLPPPVATVTAPTSARSDLDALAYGGPVGPAPAVVAPIAYSAESAYRLDAGDRLRIVVYGQEGLTNSYAVDAGGSITMPLIGAVRARGLTPAELAQAITVKLRGGYIREPYVAAEVEAYRPFFILGEVAAPGQYPYVPNMTVESAVAIAGGFSPRAQKGSVDLTRTDHNGPVRANVPLGTVLRPGDTIVVSERWF
ncbi:polysaccharide biosynthesis/export family protein [Bradyrhizobium prioriisuperbiae]|uniref:polysaccharide biosynthesis/export family protein n=1 Tax=Bradyrhizobium prioriisuperbiae TaxID=2854389 RepID=UPI0028E85BE2|nr:polysaccharide biosynthesis/export family protein [Bradyrhizobium prioritasuperba]